MTKNTTWDDTAAQPGQSYSYRVTSSRSPATNAAQSVPSHSALGYAGGRAPTEAATLVSPSGLRVSEATFPDRVRVSWNAAPDAAWYNVYRSGSATGSFINVAGTRGTTWDDTNVAPGSLYYYRVSSSRSPASNAAQSPQSESASGQAGSMPTAKSTGSPASPTGLLASDGTVRRSIHVTWSAVPGASWYNVYRATAASGPFKKVATTRATSWDDTSIESGPLYYYALSSATSAADNAPESPRSAPEAGYAGWQ
ncbi:MAG: hypothetical protein NTY63_08825 [Candidatus Bipolaricaulota bacterium]|nr:hypothetical protein [Candidatus Bipolaricaulota bacterium]